MKPQLIPFVFALLIIVWSPSTVETAELCDSNADCTSPDECIGGACVPPVPDPDAYVAEAMTRWSSYVWAVQFPALFEPAAERCCFDYTGDGVVDDSFGTMIGLWTSIDPDLDPVAITNAALSEGRLVKIFDWRELAPDLAAGDVQLSVFEGIWTDATTFQDRILGLGRTAFRRSSFDSHGALDQLNDGTVTAGLVEVAGNQFTLMLPWIWTGDGLAVFHLQNPRLEVPIADGGPLPETAFGLSSLDEDRGSTHSPQIVGGGKLGGTVSGFEILAHMDAFYRQCSCAGVDPQIPVILWEENHATNTLDIWCTDNTGTTANCDPDDPCSDLDTVCGTIGILANIFDVDHDGNEVNESLSMGLRIAFAGTTLDVMHDLFADGFESSDVAAWSNSVGFVPPPVEFVTEIPYFNEEDILEVGRVFCQSGACPWNPPSQLHDGIDFMPIQDGVAFHSVCDGTVDAVDLFLNTGNGFYQVNVIINCTADPVGGLVYAFEPMSPNLTIGNSQLSQIFVASGAPVAAGDVIGHLWTTGPASHLHWGVTSEFTQVCPQPHLDSAVNDELLALIQRDHPTWDMCY